ncbi:MAG: hypothetical protein K6F08_01075 [bacterium]|nr:hypothetical protein [bacterium]
MFKTKLKLRGLSLFIAILFTLPLFLGLAFSFSSKNVVFAADEEPVVYDPITEIFSSIKITQAGVTVDSSYIKEESINLANIVQNSSGVPIYDYQNEDNGIRYESEQQSSSGTKTLTICNVIYLNGAVRITPYETDDVNFYYHTQLYDYNNINDILLPNTAEGYGKTFNSTQSTELTLPTPGSTIYTKITIKKTSGVYHLFIVQNPSLKYEGENEIINWTNISGGSSSKIYSPGENQVYTGFLTLKLTFPNKRFSPFNEVYIEFWFNGEAYKLYINNELNESSDGYIYNYISPTESIPFEGSYSGGTYTLVFNYSGEYKVRIYDKTSFVNFPTVYSDSYANFVDYKNANYLEYNFSVVNPNRNYGFYFTAISKENLTDFAGNELTKTKEQPDVTCNKYIVSKELHTGDPNYVSNLEKQSVNNDVVLNFYNIDATRIERIYYDKYSIDGSNIIAQNTMIMETKIISGNRIALIPDEYNYDGNNAKLTLTEEATYFVYIEYVESQGTIDEQECKVVRIAFMILNGIRQSYQFNNVYYPSSQDTIADNVVKTYTLNQTYSSSYESIQGTYDSNFKLMIAKSVPRITGVTNNANISDSVSIHVHGVATSEMGLKIVVTRNGGIILNTTVYNNKDDALEYIINYGNADLGNYTVSITDAMNNSTSISFVISKPQNAAGIILIAVGSVIGIAALAFIIKSRTKVTVR